MDVWRGNMHRMLLLALLLATAAIAPVAPDTPIDIARGVVLIPGAFVRGAQPDGNTVVFQAKERLIVVDSGRHEAHTRAIVALSRDRKAPVATIVNTHWHLDHIGGNALLRSEFPAVRIFASGALEEARGGFLANYARQLEQAIATTADPAQQQTYRTELHLIENGAALAPDTVITKSRHFDQSGRRLDLHLAQHAVTAGDLWLYDRDTRVLVAGDLVTLPVPFLDTACPQGWSAALDEVAKTKFRLLVPGHGAPMTRMDFETYRRAYDDLITCSASKAGKESCIDGWMRDAAPLLKNDDPDFVRSLLDYYVGNVLRGDPSKLRERCGGKSS